MKKIFYLVILLNFSQVFAQDSLQHIQFYAYTPKIISLNSGFQYFKSANFKDNNSDKQWLLNHFFVQSINLFLPIYHNPKAGLSIINETKVDMYNSQYTTLSSSTEINQKSSMNSNITNSSLKIIKRTPVFNNKSFVLAGQVNFYGYNIFDYQKTGGSISGILYTHNTPTKSVGYGITYDMNYHMSPIIPIIIYYKQLKSNYNLEIFLPWKIGIQKIVNSKTYLYAGSNLDLELDFINTNHHPNNFESKVVESRNTNLRSYLSIQKAISNQFWVELKGGYNHYFVTNITNPQTNKEKEITEAYSTLKNYGGLFVQVGIFMRPTFPSR